MPKTPTQKTIRTPDIGELLDLNGRVALVTGASGNIGRAIAARLAAAGAVIVVHYHRDAESAEALAGRIADHGGDCTPMSADLADPAGVAALFEAMDARGLAVDLVVNNAAVQPVVPFHELTADDWRALHRTNLDAAFLVIRAAAERMRSRGKGGAIVNVGSIEGRDPAAGHAHYSASKAGLAMLSRSAALELGRDGIRVNTVAPGLIDRAGLAEDWPDGVARWRDKVPLRRLGTADDVADAVLFLLSAAARWISGAELTVDGGMSSVPRW